MSLSELHCGTANVDAILKQLVWGIIDLSRRLKFVTNAPFAYSIHLGSFDFFCWWSRYRQINIISLFRYFSARFALLVLKLSVIFVQLFLLSLGCEKNSLFIYNSFCTKAKFDFIFHQEIGKIWQISSLLHEYQKGIYSFFVSVKLFAHFLYSFHIQKVIILLHEEIDKLYRRHCFDTENQAGWMFFQRSWFFVKNLSKWCPD